MKVNSEEEEASAREDKEPYSAHLCNTITSRRSDRTTSIQQFVFQQNRTSTPTISWPSSSGSPINEFTTEGYISCAIPTLFPTGAADFVAPLQRIITVGNYSSF